MEIPTAFRVAGIEYTVRQDRDEVLEAEGISGECAYMKAQISVKSSYPDQIKAQIVVHELLHGMMYRTGLETNEIYNDENLIRPLANVLWQVLRDNDFSWLKEGVTVNG